MHINNVNYVYLTKIRNSCMSPTPTENMAATQNLTDTGKLDKISNLHLLYSASSLVHGQDQYSCYKEKNKQTPVYTILSI